MNILGKIREAKVKFSQRQNIKAAENLRDLKKTREREEGKANLIKLQNKERDRIKKAREVRFNDVRRKFGAPAPMIQTRKEVVPKKKNKQKRTMMMPEKKEEKKRAFGEGINPAFGFK